MELKEGETVERRGFKQYGPAGHLPGHGEKAVPCAICVAPAPQGVKVVVLGNLGHCAATAGPVSSGVHFPTVASCTGGGAPPRR